MKRHYSILSCGAFLLILALAGPGCSSSQMGDDFGDDVPSADAGTDAVPGATPEGGDAAATASTDPQAPPADGQATADNAAAAPSDPSQTPPPADPSASTQTASTDTPPPAATASIDPAPAADAKPAESAPAKETVASTSPETPAPTAVDPAPTASSSSSGGSETYKVRKGDTLMRIAYEKYGDLYKWKGIYEANKDKISDPNVIRPGIVLTLDNPNTSLPARTGTRYKIKQGDTLATISNDVYGTPSKWKKIWKHNKPWIPNPNKIFAGFYLYYVKSAKDAQEMEQAQPQEAPATPMAQDAATQPREPASATPGAPAAN